MMALPGAAALLLAALPAAAASGDLHFLVMADWGGSAAPPYTTAAEISTAGGMGRIAQTLNASFALAVGDNFYSSGIKTDCTDPRFKNTFEDVFTADSLQGPHFPFYVIAGNHDHGGNVTAQIAYTQRSTRWKYPSSWYSFKEDLGGGASLEVIMLDTVELAGNSDARDAQGELIAELDGDKLPGPADHARANAQMQWLKTTLQASTATFLVVAGHYPVWSICEHGPTTMMVQQIKPLLEQYHVTAFLAGHDHCMESFVQNGVDYHGMGASHSNDPSTAHKSAVPTGSLQFHAEGKSGGFGSFTVNATSFIARHHEGDGTLLYTAPTRAPRSQTPTPPPPPTPPAPPPAPPSPPAPTPAGHAWTCINGYDVDSQKLKLTDEDLMEKGGGTVASCEAACNGVSGCVAVRWHTADKHCHILSGKAPSHSAFQGALKPSSSKTKSYDACVLLKSE